MLRTSPGRRGRGPDSRAGRRPRSVRRCFRRSQLRHPLGDESHQREDRERGDDEGHVGHHELLDGCGGQGPQSKAPFQPLPTAVDASLTAISALLTVLLRRAT
ncbi:hypothetical protein T261_2158 [Streptomyces lydicus]|nr:hypothetical protein T261_2158 [Streptomyces lydicus]